jgi:hypothetical protein
VVSALVKNSRMTKEYYLMSYKKRSGLLDN